MTAGTGLGPPLQRPLLTVAYDFLGFRQIDLCISRHEIQLLKRNNHQKDFEMICHIVLYKMKPGATDADEHTLMDQARRQLGRLPGVMNLRVGKSIESSVQGYSIALVMDFQDEAALEAYRVHPDHQHFVKNIAGPVVSEISRFDFRWS